MGTQKFTILIIEDDLEVAELLNAFLTSQGMDVFTANWGEDGFLMCQSRQPDLVILDIRLPDIDGFEVARRVRATRSIQNTAIIFMTEHGGREDRLQGLTLNAEDFIAKPFDIQELGLRIRNVLARTQRRGLTNTVTGLPEGKVLDERLENWLSDPRDEMLIVISLRNISRFREVYGFLASDDLVRAVTQVLKDSLPRPESVGGFVGHLSPTDFLMIVPASESEKIRERATQQLEKSFEYFYNDRDREDIFHNNLLGILARTFFPLPGMKLDLSGLKHELETIYR